MVAGNNRYPHTQVFAEVGVTAVDDVDGDLAQHRWGVLTHKRKDGSVRQYAYRWENGRRIYLHRVIAERMGLQLGPGVEVDHRNGNSSNNHRSNLRVVTHSKNAMNARKQPGTSQFKGVSWDRQRQKWVTQITINKKQIHLGRYDTEIEAALAYDQAAKFHFGLYAKLNFPQGTPTETELILPTPHLLFSTWVLLTSA